MSLQARRLPAAGACFEDRREAGHRLAQRLLDERLVRPLVVVALPRGGVPVAAEVAQALGAPLEVLLVRKVGAPGQPELAVAAVVDGPQPRTFKDDERCASTGADASYLSEAVTAQSALNRQRRQLYGIPEWGPRVAGATAVLVDDGAATGLTARAAVQVLRERGASRIVLALPVAPPETVSALEPLCDRLVCLVEPAGFRSVGEHYRDFAQVSDEAVRSLLKAGHRCG